MSNAETAASLQIIRSTVKFHLGSLLTKLGARSRAELVIFAYESGRTRRSTGP
ncbi:response regulator transcription factor [Georgenia yuyongxinii]